MIHDVAFSFFAQNGAAKPTRPGWRKSGGLNQGKAISIFCELERQRLGPARSQMIGPRGLAEAVKFPNFLVKAVAGYHHKS